MRIKTRLLCTLLGMSLLVALLGALAVNRQHATAMAGVTEEAEDVAQLVSFLLMSDANKLSGPALQKVVTRLHVTQGRAVSLLDADQRILADADLAEVGKIYEDDPGDEIGKTLADRRVRTFVEVNATYPLGIKQIVVPVVDGSRRVTGAVVLEYTPVYNQMMRLTQATVRGVVLAGLGSVGLSLLLALYMGQSIARPLGQLTRVATGFASGRTDLPMPAPREDEIGELATAFNDMMEKRERAKADLSRLRDELEARVAERTRELAEANGDLRAQVLKRASAEHAYQQIMNHSLDAICTVDAEGRFVQVSRACESLWGYQPEELAGRAYLELVHPDDQPATIAVATSIMQGVPVLDFENRYLRKGGGTVPILWSANWSAEQQIMFCVARDMTSRRQAEAEVERSHKRLRDLIDGVGPSIFVGLLTPEGILLECNGPALAVAGLKPVDVLGKPFVNTPWWCRSPDAQQQLREAIERAARGEASRYDVQTQVAENDFIDIDFSLQPMRDETGKVVFLVPSASLITERKRAEQANERMLQRLNDAQRIGQIGDWEWDLATQAITWSPQVFEIVGRDPSLGPPRSYEEHTAIYDEASGPILQENVTRAIESGETQEYELVGRRPDGRPLQVLAMAAPRKDKTGRVIGLYGTVQDITARKRSEDALRVSDERLRAALSASGTGTFTWDFRSNELGWDDSLDGLFRLPAKTVRSLETFIAAVHADDRPGVIERCQRCTQEGANFDMEFRVVWPDGSLRWLADKGKTFFDDAGQPLYMTGACVDITERKQTEEALRKSEAEFRTLAEAMPQIVWVTRPDGWNVYLNPRWAEYTGIPLEEGKGNGWIAPFHPDDRERGLELWQRATATVSAYSHEFRMRRADGAYRWWLARAVPLQDAAGKVLQWIGTSTDIHQMKLAELEISRANSELAAAKELAEAANRAKSEFLANMSHEIRTPMNGIIGMTELVLETDLNCEQREYLGMAKSSALSLLSLINDILDFSKIEAGKLELEAIGFSLRDCVGTMLKPLGLRADAKGLELMADIPASTPDHLIGDPLRLRQILIILTDNAIKFTARGEVTLHVAVESVTGDDHCLHFSIADTGIGIPLEKQAHIFEAFAQADGTTTRTHGGTGLGLAIATHLVHQMGGRIWVESTMGEGTTFHFTVQVPVRHSPAPEVRHLDPGALAGLRVLVVDDNAINRRILRDMLLHWRMAPTVVASGATAIVELLRAARTGAPFPLVILDGMMPDMDGFMVAEQIREHTELSGATVMMLSSAMPAGAAARCTELGVSSYLTKPVTQAELMDAILLALGGAAAWEPAAEEFAFAPPTHPMRILLAEDNVINRALAAGILEKRGHSIVHAGNGREVVAAAAQEEFDLIFMDVQMPEMDGLEATRRIREAAPATGRHTPIVAMTAHAMAGDRERCLAAGMDDYLTKPLRKPELLALLARFSAARHPAGPQALPLAPLPLSTQAAAGRVCPIYSRNQLLDQLDGDEALLQRMSGLFRQNTPGLLENIRAALARRNRGELSRAAHALLSSLGVFGATTAHRLALQLETSADQNYELHDRTFAALERETVEIYDALAALAAA